MKRLGLALMLLIITIAPASAGAKEPTASLSGPSGQVEFGQVVTFAESWNNIPGWAWPMMTVGCFQDVNGDGFINASVGWNEDGVYLELLGPGGDAPRSGSQEISVLLGGGSSLWHYRPGSASCVAQAWYYSFSKDIRALGAPIYFESADSRL